MKNLLYGVAATDPVTLTAVASLLAIIALMPAGHRVSIRSPSCAKNDPDFRYKKFASNPRRRTIFQGAPGHHSILRPPEKAHVSRRNQTLHRPLHASRPGRPRKPFHQIQIGRASCRERV